jgi:glycosyltransferase involved in cell wall biosynthesis
LKKVEFIGTVSVIIPTKNSDSTLRKCLESIRRQTFQNLEMLVVDDKSKDETTDIAKEFKATIFTIEGERTAAKNFASKKASGDFLLFLDSDMILEPTVIEKCLRAMSVPRTGGVIIPEKTVGSGFWIQVRAYERSFYLGTKMESARFFATREVLKVGGFDEDLIGYEESTVPQKIEKNGLKTDVRISSFILHDEGNFNLKEWLKKKRYYASSANTYRQRYPEYSKLRMSISKRLGIYFRNGNWIKLLKHPRLTLGLIILKSLEFLFSKLKY